MVGRRVRCICGTVFDPAKKSACPACGTAYEAKPSRGVEAEAPAAPAPASEVRAQRGQMGIGGDEQTFAQKNRTLLTVVGGVGGLLVLALVVRAMFGGTGKSGTTVEGDTRAAVAGREKAPASKPPGSSSSSPRSSLPKTPAQRSSPAAEEAAEDAGPGVEAFVGNWRLLTARMQPEPVIPGLPATAMTIHQTVAAAFLGPGAVATMTIDDIGGYRIEIDVVGDGQYTANISPEAHLHSVAAQGVLTLTPRGSVVTDRARAMLKPVRMDIPHLKQKAGDTELSLLPEGSSGGAPSTWVRPGGSGQPDTTVVGTWANEQVFVDSYIPYRGTLELRDNGDYRIRFTRSEQGLLEAEGGRYEFKRSIRMGPPIEGRYKFDGPDRVTFTEPRGTATWVRGGEEDEGARRTRR